MILSMEIYLTIIILYEIIAVFLLHYKETCYLMFGSLFCDGTFKYFIACFAIPAVISLVAMWVGRIVCSIRHQHSIMHKAKSAAKRIISGVRSKLSDNLSSDDLEKIIVASFLAGLRRYSTGSLGARKKPFINSKVRDYEADSKNKIHPKQKSRFVKRK